MRTVLLLLLACCDTTRTKLLYYRLRLCLKQSQGTVQEDHVLAVESLPLSRPRKKTYVNACTGLQKWKRTTTTHPRPSTAPRPPLRTQPMTTTKRRHCRNRRRRPPHSPSQLLPSLRNKELLAPLLCLCLCDDAAGRRRRSRDRLGLWVLCACAGAHRWQLDGVRSFTRSYA